MSQIINIGTDELVSFTNRLERMHKSDLPIVVRQTLNNAAFEAKKTTLPNVLKQEFALRSPSFFKAKTRVQGAQGWNVAKMESKVGVIDDGTQSTRNMEEQEQGGRIEHRDYVPMKYARTSSTMSKKVRAKVRLKLAKKAKTAKTYSEMVKMAHAAGKGGFVRYDGKVHEIKSLKKRGRYPVKLSSVYSYEEGRSVSVRGRGFMKKTGIIQGRKLERYFIENAQKRLSR